MWPLCKKELQQFFSSLTGYIAIIVFLLVNGLVLFVFKDNIFEYGYATLSRFFELAPWVLLFLVPAISMRSFADEVKAGTFEILQTRPLSSWQVVWGKFLGCFIVVLIALLPTIIYFISIQSLAATNGVDVGATIGAYIGLFFLAATFTSISVAISSSTSNALVAFIISFMACATLYYGFHAISALPLFNQGADYFIELLGIDYHYQSISRGVVDVRDIIYFVSVIFFSLFMVHRNVLHK